LIGVKEVATYLGVHEETVRRFAREGRLPAYKPGRSWRFDRDEIRKWARGAAKLSAPSTVLVVDDDEEIRHLLREVFVEEGYDPLVTETGEEALERATNLEPDAAILDLRLPGLSGPEVLARLREEYESLPVIIMTGYPDSELMARALEHSPVTVLSKPASRAQILEAVQRALAFGGERR
jgi:excisionase family DNA binding protein